MSVGAPWSVKGIDPKAREVAKDLARRSGMTLGEWLNRVILEDDVPEEVTAEAQFGARAFRGGREPPRLHAVPSGPPDLARVAAALDRLTDRIEASETRTGLAINGVEHSVRQALARIETAEREQHASATRLEGLLAEASAQQGYLGERLRRIETEPAGPRSAEALRVLEGRLAQVEPDVIVETVLERLGDRLSAAEARTAGALENLTHTLAALDRRVGAVEHSGGEAGGTRFEAFAEVLSHRVEAVRTEVAEKIAAAGGGPAVEARFAELAQQVRTAERRSARAVEEIGRQVLAMAEAVGRKLGEVDQRSADAIDQVGSEVARIAGAVELRLARGEQVQAEAFERFGGELARLTGHFAAVPPAAVVAAPEAGEAPDTAELEAALRTLGPPPEPEPEPIVQASGAEPDTSLEPEAAPLAPEPEAETASAAFGPELFSRAEVEPSAPAAAGPETTEAKAATTEILGPETVEAPWRRLDVEVPETEIPDAFAPLADGEDEDLFRDPQESERGEELSTREVIERARAAARAAQDAPPQAEVRAGMRTVASGRLFEGFGARPRRAPRHTALQTALMVAGGAAFMSVGAAGLVLMQEPAPQEAVLSPDGAAPRAAMARSPAALPSESQPTFDKVQADVEAGVTGAVGVLKSLAEAGHAQAQLYLAQLYDEGDAGLPQDPAEARRLTTLAAESGDVKAMHNLGVYLFRGEGGAQDLPRAAHWFGRAAAAGVVESQYNLGLLYQSGSGVQQDLAEARRWFAQAAAKGDPEARRALAAMSDAPKPKPAAAAPPPAARPSAAVAASPALAGTSMNVRQTQLVLTRLGYYDGPLDGRASTVYHRALAAYRRDQTGGPPLHISQP